jgi:hypothetical protein
MIGAVLSGLGAAANIASSIFGGVKAGREMRKNVRSAEQEKSANEAWYARRSNENPTMRADAQRILAMTEDAIKRRNEQAAGTQAVMGGTNEATRANTEANAKAVSDTASAIAAQGEARKDAYEQQYLQRKEALRQEINNLRMGKAANIAQAAQGVGKAAAKAMASIGSAFDNTGESSVPDEGTEKKEDEQAS